MSDEKLKRLRTGIAEHSFNISRHWEAANRVGSPCRTARQSVEHSLHQLAFVYADQMVEALDAMLSGPRAEQEEPTLEQAFEDGWDSGYNSASYGGGGGPKEIELAKWLKGWEP